MISGQTPFGGSSAADVLAAIVHVEPKPLARLTSVPPEIDRIVSRMLQKSRDERYLQARDLIADLRSAQQDIAGTPVSTATVR